jgi:DNA-directed RNA polymerase specialized sigma subunit
VLHGQFVGELFVFMEEKDDAFCFLSIPNMKIREVPKDKYDYAIQNHVLEYVERLPKNERSVCQLQYESNMKNNENK